MFLRFNNLLNLKNEEIYNFDRDRFNDRSLCDQQIKIQLVAPKWDNLVVSGRSPRVNPFKKGNFIKVTIHHLHKLEGVQIFTLSM